MTLSERVNELEELFQKVRIDKTSAEYQIISKMSDMLIQCVGEIQRLHEENTDIIRYVEHIHQHQEHDNKDITNDVETLESIDDLDYQVVCPRCDEIIFLNSETLERGSINCKNCGELLEFDLSDLDEDI